MANGGTEQAKCPLESPDCGDKGRVGADPDIGNEKIAHVRPSLDQRSRETIRGWALEELIKMVHDL